MPSLVLQRPHTHAGKTYGVGDRIEIDATSADWLVAHGIAEPMPKSPIAPSNQPMTGTEPKPYPRKESKP